MPFSSPHASRWFVLQALARHTSPLHASGFPFLRRSRHTHTAHTPRTPYRRTACRARAHALPRIFLRAILRMDVRCRAARSAATARLRGVARAPASCGTATAAACRAMLARFFRACCRRCILLDLRAYTASLLPLLRARAFPTVVLRTTPMALRSLHATARALRAFAAAAAPARYHPARSCIQKYRREMEEA